MMQTALSQSFKGADTTSIEVTATFLEGMKFRTSRKISMVGVGIT